MPQFCLLDGAGGKREAVVTTEQAGNPSLCSLVPRDLTKDLVFLKSV